MDVTELRTRDVSKEQQELIAKKLDEYGKSFMQAFDDYESDDESEQSFEGIPNSGSKTDRIEYVDKDEGSDSEKETEDKENKNVKNKKNEIDNLLSNFDTPVKSNVKNFVHSKTGSSGYKKASAREYRLFMSPRVSDILKESKPQRISFSEGKDEKEDKDEKELINVLAEFEKIENEVKEIGKSVLKETRIRQWQVEKLVELGAKPTKNHRRHIDKGRYIIKREEQERKERQEELIASGMLRVKGSGLQRRKMENAKRKRSEADRGLKVSDGKFKNGVLHVTPLKRQARPDPDASSSRDPTFSGARSGSKGKRTKTRGNGKKKGGSGKKRRKH